MSDRQWNSTFKRRSRRIGQDKPRKPIKRQPMKRWKRKPSEFARIYHSRKRVRWVKAQPCLCCKATPSDNAHVKTEGMGRKAGYEHIAPLCRRCHRAYDRYLDPFDGVVYRLYVQWCAEQTQAAWLLVEGAAA